MTKPTEYQMREIADHCIRRADMCWSRAELIETVRHFRQRSMAAESRLHSIAEMTKSVDEKWQTLKMLAKQEEI